MTTTTPTPSELTTCYAQILMPIDFSAMSWKVLSLAKTMETAFGVPRRLVHIDTSSPWLDEGTSMLVLKAAPNRRRVQVEVVAARTVVDGIGRALGDDESSLLVMSTHGHTAAAEVTFGSAAEDVLRSWRGPVLLGGPRYESLRRAVSRLVLCVAPDTPPPPALTADLVAWANTFDVPVDVLLVHEHPDAGDPDGLSAQQAFLEKIADRFRDAGVFADVVLLRGPRPAHEIAAYAEAHPGSVLALATHARPLGARLLLGSVAMAVVRHTSSPVLLRRYEHSS